MSMVQIDEHYSSRAKCKWIKKHRKRKKLYKDLTQSAVTMFCRSGMLYSPCITGGK